MADYQEAARKVLADCYIGHQRKVDGVFVCPIVVVKAEEAVAHAIEEAVKAETERCAKIAEGSYILHEYGSVLNTPVRNWFSGSQIADAIRKRTGGGA